MNPTQWLTKVRRILAILFSCGILFFITLYISLSSTLLNPGFYDTVSKSDGVQASFHAVSDRIPEDTNVVMSSQSIQNNVRSLMDGIIRYIRQKDMTLSDIALEHESIQTIRSVVQTAELHDGADIPDISKVHPYVFTYFIPGATSIYFWFQLVQTGYTTYRFIIPVLCFFVLLLLLTSAKPAANARLTFILSGFSIVLMGILVWILQKPLFHTPLTRLSPDTAVLLTPVISQMVLLFFVRTTLIGALFFPATLLFGFTPVRALIDRYAKKTAFALFLLTSIITVLYHEEIYAQVVHNVNNTFKQQQVFVLNQEEETIHSLMIKLREEGSEQPIANVYVYAVRMDSWYHPIRLSAPTDSDGNVRFILPQGLFYIYADSSTVPEDYLTFDPVSIPLDKPDNSWYTLHLKPKEETPFHLQNEAEEKIFPSDPQSP